MKKFNSFYENETARKQMNELGLFNFFKSHKVITTFAGKVYFNPFYLSSMDENGKKSGFGNCTLSISRLKLNFPLLKI